jgi:diguanylate cyclase (GGDEF)-like protein
MQLTDGVSPVAHDLSGSPRVPAAWTLAGVGAALLLIFALDRVTGSAPVQHLYYLPIVVCAIRFGAAGGLTTAATAIVLYHVANFAAFSLPYAEADVLQVGVLIAVALVSARLASNARRLRQLAMTDDLTGLHNLRAFEARLLTMVLGARETKTPLALIVLDLDRLKSLNDVHGHLAGAEAVRTVGRILATRLPAAAAPCRYGGDEFVIALPKSDGRDAAAIAEDLRHAVSETAPVLAGAPFPAGTLSISVGIACWEPPSIAAVDDRATPEAAGEALFRAADRALYAAKNAGRNRISLESTAPRRTSR